MPSISIFATLAEDVYYISLNESKVESVIFKPPIFAVPVTCDGPRCTKTPLVVETVTPSS